MVPLKNIHFTLLIKINKRLREFNFRQRTASLYDADTGDERGNRYIFKMIKDEQQWMIQGKDLPTWITDNEQAIHEALVKKN